MNRFVNSSIRRQLTLVVLCTSLLGLGVVFGFFEVYERASFRSTSTRELTALADAAGANSELALTSYDRKSAENVLATLAAEQHIMAACFYNNYGQVFAEFRRVGIGSDFHIPYSQEDGAQFAPDFLTLRRSVFVREKKSVPLQLSPI